MSGEGGAVSERRPRPIFSFCTAPAGSLLGGAVSEAWQVEGKEAAAVLTAGAAAAAGEQVFIDYGEAGWRSSKGA